MILFPSRVFAFLCVLCVSAAVPAADADWPMHRGNALRTGCVDDKPGPKEPAVLWAHRAPEHFLASPVAQGNRLFVSGLGTFNTPTFHCLSLELLAPQRVLWSKSGPFVKQPVVCSPAVAEGLVVIGDGMHQTDGATLYCFSEDKGLPLWQHTVPGKLIHMECPPTIDKGRVYIGGGDAGVICVDLKHVIAGGKEQDIAAIQPAVEKRWAELTAAYEAAKAKDPLALPPNEDALPKAAPKLLWQAGQGKWHVDAPLAVAGDFVLAPSAYIDEDKVGKRVLLCLKAADGSVAWERPLEINPWAGATVVGDTVLVGCSSIRFDRALIKGAKGEVVAVNLANGEIKWRQAIGGGVLSAVAVKGDLAICTATDGKVRALKLADGKEKWAYDAGQPFFGGVAIAGDAVYAADLKATLHAMSLADGKKLWTLDVGLDPEVLSPGMAFGSPTVHGGQVFVCTSNIEAAAGTQTYAVACIGEKSAAAGARTASVIAVDKAKRSITIPCRVAPRKLASLQEIYPLEVVACLPSPQGQKAHETVVVFDVRPSAIAKALEEIGLKPGQQTGADGSPPSGPELRLLLELPPLVGDKPRRVPLEKAICDKRTGKPLPALKWFFTGSVMKQPDPEKDVKAYGADMGGTLITLFPVTDETVIQGNLTMKDSQLLKLETNKELLGEEGSPVKLIIEAK